MDWWNVGLINRRILLLESVEPGAIHGNRKAEI
jgi:hypothetical protein